MALDFRELRYLMEINKAGSITKAAENLYLTQPALYKSLTKIESRYNAKLFYKNNHRLVPTEFCNIIIGYAENILKLQEIMDTDIDRTLNLSTGSIRLGIPSPLGSLYFYDKIYSFHQQYPGIVLEILEGGGLELSQQVELGALDVAFAMRPIYSDQLNEICIIRDQVACCVNNNHPWSKKACISIEDFQDTPFISFNEKFDVNRLLKQKFREKNIKMQLSLSGEEPLFLFKYATLSNSILVLPAPIIRAFSTEGHTIIPFLPAFPWEISIVFRKNYHITYAVNAFINYLQAAMFSSVIS